VQGMHALCISCVGIRPRTQLHVWDHRARQSYAHMRTTLWETFHSMRVIAEVISTNQGSVLADLQGFSLFLYVDVGGLQDV
jgi:hypothetical protein